MHIGAVASAVSRAFPKATVLAWSIGGVIASTRVLVLAHWMTDVIVGLGVGAGIEHGLFALEDAVSADRRNTA
jgi:undecaprenyl-diphosphatase